MLCLYYIIYAQTLAGASHMACGVLINWDAQVPPSFIWSGLLEMFTMSIDKPFFHATTVRCGVYDVFEA